MAEQPGPRDISIPDEPANTDKAEGSRENVNNDAGGISNRPLSRENEDQEQLPPRASSKAEAHA
jgi:hypothetical protein